MNYLIKPVSSLCNMRWRYCFYEDETNNRSVKDLGILSPQTSDLLIREALSNANRQEYIHFSFQVGEPTLAGVAFSSIFLKACLAECAENPCILFYPNQRPVPERGTSGSVWTE